MSDYAHNTLRTGLANPAIGLACSWLTRQPAIAKCGRLPLDKPPLLIDAPRLSDLPRSCIIKLSTPAPCHFTGWAYAIADEVKAIYRRAAARWPYAGL